MVGWDRTRRVTATEASSQLGDVSPQLFAMWVRNGKLKPVGKRGRSPLYAWGDVIDVEKATRTNPNSARNPYRGLPQPEQLAA